MPVACPLILGTTKNTPWGRLRTISPAHLPASSHTMLPHAHHTSHSGLLSVPQVCQPQAHHRAFAPAIPSASHTPLHPYMTNLIHRWSQSAALQLSDWLTRALWNQGCLWTHGCPQAQLHTKRIAELPTEGSSVSNYPHPCMYVCMYVRIYVSIYPSICLSIHLPIYLSIIYLSISLSDYLSNLSIRKEYSWI